MGIVYMYDTYNYTLAEIIPIGYIVFAKYDNVEKEILTTFTKTSPLRMQVLYWTGIQ